MTSSHQPFDPVAADYDAQFTQTEIGRLQRDRVYAYLHTLLAQEKPSRILELNCGTGEDALFLARQGIAVTATDSSPQMVGVTEAKARKAGLDALIDTRVCPIEDLQQLPADSGFDWAFSNFGGLNCIPPDQLPPLRENLASLLAPSGHFIAVIMPRFCLWESLYFLSKMKSREVLRRLSRRAVQANLGTTSLPIWYYSPRYFSRQFAPDFRVVAIRPIGLALPPSYLDSFFSQTAPNTGMASALRGTVWEYFVVCRPF